MFTAKKQNIAYTNTRLQRQLAIRLVELLVYRLWKVKRKIFIIYVLFICNCPKIVFNNFSALILFIFVLFLEPLARFTNRPSSNISFKVYKNNPYYFYKYFSIHEHWNGLSWKLDKYFSVISLKWWLLTTLTLPNPLWIKNVVKPLK